MPPQVPPVRAAGGVAGTPTVNGITVTIAAVAWAGCWFAGNLFGVLVLGLVGPADGTAVQPLWVTAVGALALWVPILIGLQQVSVRYGSGDVRRDLGFSFAPIDLLGVPIGVLTQLVLLRIVYWPLQAVWPSVFSAPDIEKSARKLYDSADGLWLVVLVLLVVVGAPLVEELLYRGLLQGAFTRRINDVLAVVLVAAWFAIIHFRPVELPGLFVVGLVFGACALVTRRLGMSIVAHFAFNATGLIWVATR
ncbi:MAG: CPBP family intramembrane glutamic endopeptidase [Ilumatobacteraceae bacterium]